eukprot:5239021-Pleurochrysis_carterae.AAC.1
MVSAQSFLLIVLSKLPSSPWLSLPPHHICVWIYRVGVFVLMPRSEDSAAFASPICAYRGERSPEGISAPYPPLRSSD